MRFTVSKKVISALAVILVAGILSMLIIYQGLRAVDRAMRELADVKEPISAAAYEMEINVNGIGLSVLKYLEHTDPTYRELVKDDEKDFEHFHAKYLQMAQTKEEKELGRKIGQLYGEFRLLGQKPLGIKDDQETLFRALGAVVST